MEINATIPDKLANDVKLYAGRKSLNESLIFALEEWLSLRKIKELNKKIEIKPLQFSRDFSAEAVRSLNRHR